MMVETLPRWIESEEELEEVQTRPRRELIEFVKTLDGPLLLLGVGGKMGPSLAILARRALLAAGKSMEIIAVSRFSEASLRERLEGQGIQTISCDLMERREVERLPEAGNVVYLVGLKFGTSQNPASTWAVNTLVPALIAERYARSRIVALSSGSLYPLVTINEGGSRETSELNPLGEYANACIARERIFEYFSQKNSTPVALLRLFYAVELRYGVLVDIALKVYREQPIDLAMGYFNYIWQADANEMILRALSLPRVPPEVVNLTHPESQSVRLTALRFGEMMNRTVRFVGTESSTALLAHCGKMSELLGDPSTSLDQVMEWIVRWLQIGGRSIGKPTHFEVRDGKY